MTLSADLTFTQPVIAPIADAALQARLQHKIDHKTKPAGALGRLEGLALQLGLIQRSETITLQQPQMVVFAADHGVTAEGVSAFPQAVTVQMVANMLAGGAAINVFARQHGFALQVVDAGVAADLPAHPQLQPRKVAWGTRNVCMEPAMSSHEAQAALCAGMQVVQALPGNVVALGEMGGVAAVGLHRADRADTRPCHNGGHDAHRTGRPRLATHGRPAGERSAE